MTHKNFAALLLLLFAMLYLLQLPGRPLFTPDETRYAEIPREMITSNDWVVPRINGLRYFEKPPMGYWLTAVSLLLFGENNYAVRFPSALATGLTSLLVFFLALRSFGPTGQIPGLATLVYLTSLGVALIGTVAVLDTPLTFFLTATLVAFFVTTEQNPGSVREKYCLFLAGLLVGCTFLTKGFLAFVVPVLTVGPYLLLQGRLRDTLRMLLLPVAGALVVSLPWSVFIHLREPDFWHYFFWNEHVRRFISNSAQHAEPFWFFIAVLPAMFLPWTLLLPASIFGAKQLPVPSGKQKRLLVFSLCWFVFPFLFFSLSRGKLITYILPCFAPLSILFAYGLNWWLEVESPDKEILQWGIGLLLLIAGIALPLLAGLQLFGPEQLNIFHRSWKWLLLEAGLAAMGLTLLVAFKNSKARQKIILFALSFAVLIFTAHFTLPVQTMTVKAPGPLIMRHAGSITPTTTILSGEEAVRAICWYLKRDDILLIERAGELQNGLNYEDARQRKLSPAQAGEFIKNHRGKTVLIARQKEYSRWLPYLPSPVSVDSNGRNGYLLIWY